MYLILPWADSKQPVSWWQTENDVKIGLDSSDEKLHRIRQKVGKFLLDGWHQSLSKTEIERLVYEPEISGNAVNVFLSH